MPGKIYQPRYERPDFATALAKLGSQVSNVHKACDSVTPIDDRDFDNLVDSIKQHGLLRPIEVDAERRLIDGRSRIMACYVAGVNITPADINVTSADPQAIAESNAARRHLTVDQRAMAAVKYLLLAREKAAEQKYLGAKKGRDNRNTPLSTESVDNGAKVPKRRSRTSDDVARAQGVPREKLEAAEKVCLANPALAEQVSDGIMPLNEAADVAGVKRPRKRQKAKATKRQLSVEKPKCNSLVFDDGVTSITDRLDGIRVVRCKYTTLYCHADVDVDVHVCLEEKYWWFGPSCDVRHSKHEQREKAESDALELMQSFSESP